MVSKPSSSTTNGDISPNREGGFSYQKQNLGNIYDEVQDNAVHTNNCKRTFFLGIVSIATIVFVGVSMLQTQNSKSHWVSKRLKNAPTLGLANPIRRKDDTSLQTYTEEARSDYIEYLPGLDYDPGFHQFSGYLTIDSKGDEFLQPDVKKHMFYWYVESQNDPKNDPVIFWTNGGPGCSGLVGFGMEHGPYYINSKALLSENPYSWNKIANIIYIEAPVGVGFSYADDVPSFVVETEIGNDSEYLYKGGDAQTAADNYKVIREFFKRFPERKDNHFYVASESYGGHYMPQLSLEILNNNINKEINFKGMMVGNPFVDDYSNTITQIDTYYLYGLIAKPLYDRWNQNCRNDPKNYNKGDCDGYTDALFEEIGDGINLYGLDYPVCLEDENEIDVVDEFFVPDSDSEDISTQNKKRKQKNRQRDDGKKGMSSQIQRHIVQSKRGGKGFQNDFYFKHYHPCGEVNTMKYLSRIDVQEALHVRTYRYLQEKGMDRSDLNDDDVIFDWKECTDFVDYSDEDFYSSTIPLYKQLVEIARNPSNGINLNIMIFSGDDDSICSTASTQHWIWDMGVSPIVGHLWKPWSVLGQTAGYATLFDLSLPTEDDGTKENLTGRRLSSNSGFAFVTVHGAGHEVPAYRPLEALHLLQNFLSGEW